ncbi:MAG: hypothetical protein JWN13_1288, partial [Betaproteobacteria bacterium]|nr:hypothetical protein [Betaproteobacteria bacterium]
SSINDNRQKRYEPAFRINAQVTAFDPERTHSQAVSKTNTTSEKMMCAAPFTRNNNNASTPRPINAHVEYSKRVGICVTFAAIDLHHARGLEAHTPPNTARSATEVATTHAEK